jgi:sec-independent protein translocase protein TatA
MDIGPAELLIVLLIVLLLFGGAKLPKLARSIGEAKREFERGQRADEPPDGEHAGGD